MTAMLSNGMFPAKLFQNINAERSEWTAVADYFSKFGEKHFKASDLVKYFSSRGRECLEAAAFDDAFPTPDKKFPDKSNSAAMGSLPTSDRKFPEKSNLAAVNHALSGKRPEMLKLDEHVQKNFKNLTSEMCQTSLKEIGDSSIAFQQAMTASKLSETVLFRVDTLRFFPSDISVKVVDNFVHIHAKHAEKIDEHGLVSREFTRKYKLPENLDPLSVKATYDRRGLLAIHAEKKGESKEGKAVPVTIVDSAILI